jgi:hypothetical protein
LQKYLFPNRALSFYFREVVFSDCIHQAGEDVVAPLALLLGDADVGIDECRASGFEFNRRRRSQRKVCDVADIDPKIALRALLKK